MSRVHIYCRVSSAGQEEGYSLDTQEAACRAWAAERGLPVASVVHEIRSGGDRYRPELDAMLDRLLPGDVFLAYALDRFSRSQIDTAILIDRIDTAGASLQLVTEDFEKSPVGTFIRGAKAFAAELELEKIRERTQRGRRARVDGGKPIVGGRPAYGYVWNHDKTRLLIDPETAPVARMIFEWALDGVPLRGIATRLAEQGTPSLSGQERWTPAVIRELVRRPVYSGTYVAYRRRAERKTGGKYTLRPGTAEELVTIPGIAEPIITAEEQAMVISRLENNKANAHRNNPTPELALLRAGFIRCGLCGRSLGVRNAPKDRPNRAATYQQCDTPGCQRATITTSNIDEAVWLKVCKVLRSPGIIAEQLDKHREDGGFDRDLAAIDKRLEGIVTKQTTLARHLAMVSDDAAEPLMAELELLATSKRTLEQDRKELERRMADAQADREKVRTLTDWCGHVATKLDTATYEQKRQALEALGVIVKLYAQGSVDADRNPLPRWMMTMRPLACGEPIVYAKTSFYT